MIIIWSIGKEGKRRKVYIYQFEVCYHIVSTCSEYTVDAIYIHYLMEISEKKNNTSYRIYIHHDVLIPPIFVLDNIYSK